MAKKELKVKVIRVSDYYQEAREQFGANNIFINALAICYSDNTVIDKIERKGDLYLIVK